MHYKTTISSKEAQERKQSNLAPGYYLLTIVATEDTTSKNGIPMTVVTFLHGESQEKFQYYLLYKENMAWKIDRFLACIGMEFQEGVGIDINDQLCRGRQVVALVGWEHGKNEGVKFPKVIDIFNPRSSSCPQLGQLPPEQYELHRLTREGFDPYSAPKATAQGGGYQGSYNNQAAAPRQQGYQSSYQQQGQGAFAGQDSRAGYKGYQPPANAGNMQGGLPHEQDDDLPF